MLREGWRDRREMTVSKGMALREAVTLTVGLALTLTLTLTLAMVMLTMTMATSPTLMEMELLTGIVLVLVLMVVEVVALLVVDHDAYVACAPLSFPVGGCSLMTAVVAFAAVYPVAPAGLLVIIVAAVVLAIAMRRVVVAVEMWLVSGTCRMKRARHVDGG